MTGGRPGPSPPPFCWSHILEISRAWISRKHQDRAGKFGQLDTWPPAGVTLHGEQFSNHVTTSTWHGGKFEFRYPHRHLECMAGNSNDVSTTTYGGKLKLRDHDHEAWRDSNHIYHVSTTTRLGGIQITLITWSPPRGISGIQITLINWSRGFQSH